MDIQDKKHNNSLLVRYVYNDTIIKIDLDKINEVDTLFRFNENSTIELELNSENYDVRIECYSYYLNDVFYECEDNILKLENGKSYQININGSDEVSYYPDKYKIFISKESDTIEYFFEVSLNKETKEEGHKKIVNSLNNFIDGLAHDYLKKSKQTKTSISNNVSDAVIYEFVEKNTKRFSQHASFIRQNIKTNIKTSYKKESNERKQNLHTIRYNSKSILPNQFYNVKKEPAINLRENIQLKYYLTNIKKILIQKHYDFKDSIKNKIIASQNLKEKLEKQKYKLNTRQSRSNTIIIQNNIKNLEEILKENNKWIKKLESWNDSQFLTINTINSLLSNEGLNKLPIEFVSGDLFNTYSLKNYRFFQDYYKVLLNGLSGSAMLNQETTGYRRSYLLFELYGFIIIQNILFDLGYEIINPISNPYDFNSDVKFEFTKETKKIVVLYDHYCEKYYDATNDQMVSINSHHCKPDFIILYYDNDVLIKANIIDMKYRYLNNLIVEGTTEIDNIIEDYKQLKYYNNETKKCLDVVDNVIIIFPKLDEKIIRNHIGIYAGINITLDKDSSITYKDLKSLIED